MKSLTAIATLMMLVSGPAMAQKIHKWVDKDGNVHYGQTVPPEYADQLDSNKKEAAETVEATRSAYTEQELARRKEQARQREEDLTLLRTYLSV
jgi:uncharacterized protein YdeI (BOF family)